MNQALINDGRVPRYSQQYINRYKTGKYPYFYPDVNWVQEVIGKNNVGMMKYFNFNSAGGGKRVNYLVNLTYQGETGFYNHTNNPNSSQTNFDRVNFRIAGEMHVSENTDLGVDLEAKIQSLSGPTQFNILSIAYNTPANAYPIKNPDGSYGGTRYYRNNPIARLAATGHDKRIQRSLILNGHIDQNLDQILKGLSASLRVGIFNSVINQENNTRRFLTKKFSPVFGKNGMITDTLITTYGKATDLSPHRFISKGLNKAHISAFHLKARVNYDTTFAASSINAFIMFKQDGRSINVTNDTYRWQNLAGNIHYGLYDKYFLDLTLSYSGSNRIQPTMNRWGLFWAVSGAWLISEENFLQNSSFINMLKIRAGYGKVGNGYVPIGITTKTTFRMQPSWSYNFRDNNRSYRWGLRQNILAASYKTFESSYETNIGLDMKLANQFTLSADVFYTIRKDILVGPTPIISGVIGINFYRRPQGEVHNKGFGIEAGWSNQFGDFRVGISGNMSFAKNKIINMNETPRIYDYQKRTGRPIGQLFGLVADGLFQSQKEINKSPTQKFGKVVPGDIKYINQNSDNVINQADRVPIGGTRYPKMRYGGTINLGYKGFNLNLVLQGAAKRSVILNTRSIFWPLKNGGNLSTWYKDYYRPGNKAGATLPRLSAGANSNNFQNSTLWLRDGSFLKLRFVQLSYSLPESITSSLGLNNVSVYMRGRNLFTISKIDYLDPENLYPGYPSIRAYNVGMKIKF